MYAKFFKRAFDFISSFCGLIALSPLLLFLILIGLVAMKGNPFFLQARPGLKKKNGEERIFYLIKFRTMSNKRDSNGELLPDEKRLNRYGKFIRSTSLDELPSLINVFLGQLSIVGPRPLLVRDMVFMTDNQRERHSVRPGLTGLAQISGRNNIAWEQKLEYDLQYIEGKITFLKDMKIIFQTIGKVIKRSDTVRDGTVSDMDFGDWLLMKGVVSEEVYSNKQNEAKSLLGIEDKDKSKK